MNIADETLTDYSLSVVITILNQRIIYKEDIEFVTEFQCLLGHPVLFTWESSCKRMSSLFICFRQDNTLADIQFIFRETNNHQNLLAILSKSFCRLIKTFCHFIKKPFIIWSTPFVVFDILSKLFYRFIKKRFVFNFQNRLPF